MKLFGIKINFSFTSIILVAMVSYFSYAYLSLQLNSYPVSYRIAAAVGVGVLLIFSLLFHEFTHALVARRFGHTTRQISVWALGGAAHIEGRPKKPGHLFWYVFLGPVSSLFLGVVFGVLTFFAAFAAPPLLNYMLFYLAVVNVALAIFNMVPALPLDGGRVLHAILWKITGSYLRGGVIAAWVGIIISIAGFIWSLSIRDWWLAFICVFVGFMANVERTYYSDTPRGQQLRDEVESQERHDDDNE